MNDDAARLKHLAALCTTITGSEARPYVALDNIESWTGELAPNGALEIREPGDGSGIASVERGDVLFGKLRPYLAKTWIADRPAYASTELLCMRPEDGVDSRWLSYVSRSQAFVQWAIATSDGTKMPRTSWEKMGSYRLRRPPLAEQQAIADFLGAETARTDALIARKVHMAELLETRYQSWLRRRIRQLSVANLSLKRRWRVVDCKHRTPAYVSDGGYPVVSPGDIEPGRLELTRAHRFVDEADYADLTGGGRRPKRGDIIYSRNASIGIAAYVDTERPFCMGQDVCLITSDDQDQLYLSYVLNSLGVDQLQIEKLGTTFSRINVSQILELRIPVPEPSEQRELSAAFDRQRQRVDNLLAKLTRQIGLLAERRQALITAAVTGELEVAGSISERGS